MEKRSRVPRGPGVAPSDGVAAIQQVSMLLKRQLLPTRATNADPFPRPRCQNITPTCNSHARGERDSPLKKGRWGGWKGEGGGGTSSTPIRRLKRQLQRHGTTRRSLSRAQVHCFGSSHHPREQATSVARGHRRRRRQPRNGQPRADEPVADHTTTRAYGAET